MLVANSGGLPALDINILFIVTPHHTHTHTHTFWQNDSAAPVRHRQTVRITDSAHVTETRCRPNVNFQNWLADTIDLTGCKLQTLTTQHRRLTWWFEWILMRANSVGLVMRERGGFH